MARVVNYPNACIEQKIDAPEISGTVHELQKLYKMEKPKTDEEFEQRVSDYFRMCEETGQRPGVEQLCLSLGIVRQTLLNWRNGQGCSRQRQEMAEKAHQFIAGFLENVALSGKLNVAQAIFLQKNWLGYKDAVEISTPSASTPIASMTPEEIAKIIEDDIPVDSETEIFDI